MTLLLPMAALAAATTPSAAEGIDWDLVLKALGFLVAAVAAYFQLRNLGFAARTSLKTDLEILKVLDLDDPHHAIVKQAVDRRIAELYGAKPQDSQAVRIERWTLGVSGALWTMGFAYWTFALNRPLFSWWSLLTGYLAFAGLGILLMGITGKGVSRQARGAVGVVVAP